jgi:hypothetical protein
MANAPRPCRYAHDVTAALNTAAASFKATLAELGLSGDEPEFGDAAQLGQRAAMVAVAGVVWRGQLGPLLDMSQAGELLGVANGHAVHDLVQRRRLLAVSTEDGRTLIPVFQFSETGRPHKAVSTILRIFDEVEATGWTIASWFTTPNPELDRYTPIGWIKAGRDVDGVADAAYIACAPLRS